MSIIKATSVNLQSRYTVRPAMITLKIDLQLTVCSTIKLYIKFVKSYNSVMLKRAVLLLVLIFFCYVLNAFLNPYPKKIVPLGFRPQYGFSYSFEQARWYGYDGRAAFTKLLDEAKFDWVRLPFFLE